MSTVRVVLATDGSIESDIGGMVLQRLPLRHDAAYWAAMVTDLHAPVLAGLGASTQSVAGRSASDNWRVEKQIARQTVERVAQRLSPAAQPVVLQGEVAEQLLKLVKSEEADLVVSGSGAHSRFASLFLGSVSRKLVLYSEASVLIGRKYSKEQGQGSYCRLQAKDKLDLLVAVDGSDGSELAIESLSKLSRPAFGRIFVLAVEPLTYAAPGLDPSLLLPSFQCDLERVYAIADAAAKRIQRCGEHVEAITAFGRPSTEIATIAQKNDVDLIVMGANRHGALERFLLGSCASETVTGAPCSVLVLRNVLPLEDQSS
ncbi:MAG TPA: universal stress protein [Fimbriimonadaceae bacterium]|nr:universal stress protein [Fimbriimonadaceae bacterium]